MTLLRERRALPGASRKLLATFQAGVKIEAGRDREEAMSRCRLFVVVLLSAILPAVGCGGNPSNCDPTGLNVGPATAAVNHTAVPPANSQTFAATFQLKNGCAGIATAALVNSNWSASDPSVALSASPSGQVTATCTAAVAGPVTITANQVGGQMLTGKAMLICN